MTYRIHHYPVHMIDVVQLASGARVTVRPALPQDSHVQRAFFRGLSAEARYFRFMTRLGEPSDEMLERLSNIDHRTHVGLLAEIFSHAGESMIGEARYIVDEQKPAACELAIAVAEAWRATGLARMLLQRLVSHATTAGLQRMVADTISSNAAMIGLARRAGFTVTRKSEDSRLVRLTRDLARDALHSTTRSRLTIRRPQNAGLGQD